MSVAKEGTDRIMFRPNDPIAVLIVDDDRSIVASLATFLDDQGFDVLTAEDGGEAMRILREVGPPLVMTDWMMPGMDGLELCRRIRSAEEIGFTYLILLTANTSSQQVVKGFEAGADDYIFKPFDVRMILSRIKAAERIIRLEAFYRFHTVELHKVNAEVAVKNGELNRLTRQLNKTRNEAQEALIAAQEASRAKTEFLTNMSHEIRTPLTAIIGYTELLRGSADQCGWPREDIKALETIGSNGEHLAAIINDLLDLSKIMAGRLGIKRVPCRPREIVASVIAMMKLRAESKGLQLQLEYGCEVPDVILTDPIRLKQILINLVGNAVKFTLTGSVRLVVHLTKDSHSEPMILFDVIDTGLGIKQDQLQRLFQPFVQADNSLAREFGGTGLGLTISKRLAGMLGGELTVTSRYGRGSTFRVTIKAGKVDHKQRVEKPDDSVPAVAYPESRHQWDPTIHSPGSAAGWQKPCSLHPAGAAGLECRILLVEDNPDSQRLISLILAKAGAEVTVARNGRIGVEQALQARDKGHPFDIILMDIQMPVMDGFTATRLLRDRSYTGPIIALTAHVKPEDRRRCLQSGFDNFAPKPIQRTRLIHMLQDY